VVLKLKWEVGMGMGRAEWTAVMGWGKRFREDWAERGQARNDVFRGVIKDAERSWLPRGVVWCGGAAPHRMDEMMAATSAGSP
jgi:hypothetical protein